MNTKAILVESMAEYRWILQRYVFSKFDGKSLSAVGMGVSEIPDLLQQVDTDRLNRLIQDALAEDEELWAELAVL